MSGPVFIQGAEESELCVLRAHLAGAKDWDNGGYLFSRGLLAGQDTVLCRTDVGMVNAACATALGLQTLSPSVVINQGTAGAHVEELSVGDLVIGETSVHLSDLEMPCRGRGEGSNPFQWTFTKRAGILYADRDWVSRLAAAPYGRGNKMVGRLGAGDLFSREVDRILWLREQRGALCEDMESAAVYQVCARVQVPCVGVRIISNNELTGAPYRESVAMWLQEFFLQFFEQGGNDSHL